MNLSARKLFRVAEAIYEQFRRTNPQSRSIYLPDYAWSHIVGLKRQIDRARRQGWRLAANVLVGELMRACDRFQQEFESACRALAARSMRLPATVGAIFQGLRALENEFESVAFDLKTHELIVTTDTIELEDVFLGQFEIRLRWNEIEEVRQPYRVVALDPHPAAKSSDITHPHVQDERLCEGDGTSAIAAALTERRIFDFFLLVSQVLHTYGRGSAYVELEHWTGSPCSDCGDSVVEDERYYCTRCDHMTCGECALSCSGCSESFCSGCLSECSGCSSEYCNSCMEDCSVCHEPSCEDCRTESGVCNSCRAKQAKELEHESNETQQELPVAAAA